MIWRTLNRHPSIIVFGGLALLMLVGQIVFLAGHRITDKDVIVSFIVVVTAGAYWNMRREEHARR